MKGVKGMGKRQPIVKSKETVDLESKLDELIDLYDEQMRRLYDDGVKKACTDVRKTLTEMKKTIHVLKVAILADRKGEKATMKKDVKKKKSGQKVSGKKTVKKPVTKKVTKGKKKATRK